MTTYGAVGELIGAGEVDAADSSVQVVVACGAGAADAIKERAEMRNIEKCIVKEDLHGRATEVRDEVQ